MSAPKVHIGRAYGHQGLRTHRTLNDAFGPYARLAVQERAKVADRIVGLVCAVIVVLGLAWALVS